MSCLIAIHGHPDQFMNVAAIVTMDTRSYLHNTWRNEYYGNGTNLIASESYIRQSDGEARLHQIEKLVNSKCGTNIKFTVKK